MNELYAIKHFQSRLLFCCIRGSLVMGWMCNAARNKTLRLDNSFPNCPVSVTRTNFRLISASSQPEVNICVCECDLNESHNTKCKIISRMSLD